MFFLQFYLRNDMKIRIDDAQKLATALDAVNLKADVHTAGLAEIMGLDEPLDKKLSALLPKNEWKGSRASYMSGGSVPNAYKYQRIITMATLERGAGAWFGVGLCRLSIWGDADALSISLTPAQRDAAVARFSLRFTVQGA